jgi:uncharacterized protein (DUF934 family)
MRPDRVIHANPPRVVQDAWHRVDDPTGALPEGPVIVPLALWTSRRDGLEKRGDVGVWLGPDDDPQALRGGLDLLRLVAVHFPKPADGRGYSTAVLLRRFGYAGELRAFGDIGRDHLLFLLRCGFDSFMLPPERDPDAALEAFSEFSFHYQGSADDPVPLYRRRAAGRYFA